MNLENVKILLIGTAVAFSGGLLRVLISIQNKEEKKAWEHGITLLIVIIVGFTMSYVMHKASMDEKWYTAGVLFVLGYGYDKFLRMITTNLPNWIDKMVINYLENKYGVSANRGAEEEKSKKEEDNIE